MACQWLTTAPKQKPGTDSSAVGSEAAERMSEAGEPTGARGSRRLSVVRAVREHTRSESEGEHVCGPGVILTTSVKGAREISAGRSPLAKQVARAVRARQNHVISPEGAQRLSAEGGSMRGVGRPQTAGWYPPNEVSREAGAMRGASRSGAGLTFHTSAGVAAMRLARASSSGLP